MIRLLGLTIGLGLIVSLAGCGETCESVRKEIDEIGREIEKDPESAWDRREELEELMEKMDELKCMP